ncbi:T9SS type A sorting domain-containing protein, partial [Flavobacterium saliperosum]
GFNNFVYTMATQADGKILVGGHFTNYNGVAENDIIRLNADGTNDTTFNIGTGFNDSVHTIAPQADGKILVGGSFTTYKGVAENRIIRLNTDGTNDTTFNIGTGFNNGVGIIAPQVDGKILVGGYFTTYKDNNSSAFLIGLHSETSLATPSFNPLQALTIYPNPVNEVLQLHLNNFTRIKTVKIIDLQGKLVLENYNNETINVTKLSKGMYIVKVTTEEGELSKKFIKY